MTNAEADVSLWLNDLGLAVRDIRGLTGDVSRRRYFRLALEGGATAIAVHYPADMRSVCSRFLVTSALLTNAGVRTPSILETDCERGCMLVEDAGETSLYDLAGQPWKTLEPLYLRALEEADRIESLSLDDVSELNPPLDGAALRRELDLSWTCLLDREAVSGPARLRLLLRSALGELSDHLDDAPLVPCHRDFMARNLLLADNNETLVVIDHQDLRLGPRSYDLASLLNDSLFPPSSFERQLRDRLVTTHTDLDLYRRCAVQRTLKAAYTFVRFASLGNPGHLALVRPTLVRAAHQLACLPEGGSFVADVLAHWQKCDAAEVAKRINS